MDAVFDKALSFTFGVEGGYSNSKADPGGPTNLGVTQGAYTAWRKSIGRGWRFVAYITRQEAIDLYRKDYWLAGRCDDMPEKIAIAHFDACVNHGVGGAAMMLQVVAGVKADGAIGPKTLAAVNLVPEPEFLRRLLNHREEHYLLSPSIGWLNRKTHLNGWINRVNKLRRYLGVPVPLIVKPKV